MKTSKTPVVLGSCLFLLSLMTVVQAGNGYDGPLALANRNPRPDNARFAETRSPARFQPGKAVVRSVRGTAEYRDRSARGSRWKSLPVGAILYSGYEVRTGPNSQVDLFLGVNGPVVRINPNSVLEIESLRYAGKGDGLIVETILSVPQGTVQANLKKASPDSRYEIRTPHTTSTILK